MNVMVDGKLMSEYYYKDCKSCEEETKHKKIYHVGLTPDFECTRCGRLYYLHRGW